MVYIYEIRNLINGKFYIGSTLRRKHIRKYEHFSELRKNEHCNAYLQRSFNKYGETNFKFSILETLEFPVDYSKQIIADYLVCREMYLVNSLGADYNMRKDTGIGNTGYHHSEETRKKISQSNISKNPSKITSIKRDREKRRLEGKLYNTNPKIENKKFISLSLKGRKHTPEAIAKIAERSRQKDNVERIKLIQKEAAKKRIGLHQSRESKIKMMNTKFKKHRQIEIKTKEGSLVAICDFSPDAAIITGVKRSAISNNLAGLSKSAGGYTFTYKN